ncbi:adenylate/guanylate cyclase domain-containing protein [Bradyrhizobium elkanii]|uniref:adenylate/guanylate cyclase domain-containing protein n=1 Tax=Bradyrhizobium elkanii TaxID=29448 RepID=UPI00209D0E5A|nr:adenylate/guanylate cyclase domain-containing protein [Bradyrhizobium elkanii]MCP1972535.1 pimeloyl-ACP methyl ester carboxylesterase [Bradyrhizobium elkanii]MCS3519732.1 pimeloyl-ACP methyl ester carboxylesterase [Bradyrhizobium elkanii]MCS4067387.1 pimeloyl-ACP methyl ester carboxylesterase [Bradyrhizobium elkanii]MCS4082923.1 pimeloyl-ACP methyl ester carboxylesterase [Bradyrhizobium elkanii]MCS4105956.1 pimeloyl-ACP methyl ester carboxylesterase [Bradyrhizobium elkanii]
MTDFRLPETHYAQSADASIAYQVMGDGPVDIILVPGLFTHIEFMHEMPGYTAVLRRLSRFARVVTFDKRGQGLSDRMTGAPSLEQRMDDVRAIMDAIGSTKAVLFGFSEGCPMSVLFAATYPDRVSHLVLLGSFARSKDRLPDDLWQLRCDEIVQNWGSGDTVKTVAPSQAANAEVIAQIAKFERLSSSPGALRTLLVLNRAIDVTTILPMLQTPTLVLHRTGDARVPVALGRAVARSIPGAKYVEYPGCDHYYWVGETEAMLGDVEEFVTGHRDGGDAELDRVLATVLFTDIVDSTRSAAVMGDHRWRRLLDDHDQLAQQMVGRHRGHLVKSTGDGILATFDGPGRAVRCALAFGSAARQIGLPVRAGLHTGEIEVRGADIGGIAVHAAARVMSQCGSNEVLVSRVVTDLVAGAGLKFTERGAFELKGLPGTWELFAASG